MPNSGKALQHREKVAVVKDEPTSTGPENSAPLAATGYYPSMLMFSTGIFDSIGDSKPVPGAVVTPAKGESEKVSPTAPVAVLHGGSSSENQNSSPGKVLHASSSAGNTGAGGGTGGGGGGRRHGSYGHRNQYDPARAPLDDTGTAGNYSGPRHLRKSAASIGGGSSSSGGAASTVPTAVHYNGGYSMAGSQPLYG
ncbi:unnamed protein product, partial [Phaeothamnion confervicola]